MRKSLLEVGLCSAFGAVIALSVAIIFRLPLRYWIPLGLGTGFLLSRPWEAVRDIRSALAARWKTLDMDPNGKMHEIFSGFLCLVFMLGSITLTTLVLWLPLLYFLPVRWAPEWYQFLLVMAVPVLLSIYLRQIVGSIVDLREWQAWSFVVVRRIMPRWAVAYFSWSLDFNLLDSKDTPPIPWMENGRVFLWNRVFGVLLEMVQCAWLWIRCTVTTLFALTFLIIDAFVTCVLALGTTLRIAKMAGSAGGCGFAAITVAFRIAPYEPLVVLTAGAAGGFCFGCAVYAVHQWLLVHPPTFRVPEDAQVASA